MKWVFGCLDRVPGATSFLRSNLGRFISEAIAFSATRISSCSPPIESRSQAPNGAGKSTLIRRIVAALNVPADRVTYVPQEIDAAESARILARVQQLPKKTLGVMMTVISRLGSRPQRLLESIEPSPGETRPSQYRRGFVAYARCDHHGRTDGGH